MGEILSSSLVKDYVLGYKFFMSYKIIIQYIITDTILNDRKSIVTALGMWVGDMIRD